MAAQPPTPIDYQALETPSPARPDTSAASSSTVRHVIVDYPRIILFAIAAFLVVRFLGTVARELLLFVFALIFAVVLNAPVRLLEKRGVSRGISVAGVAVILFASIGATFYTVGPRLASETASLVRTAPERLTRIHKQVLQRAKPYPQIVEYLHENESLLDTKSVTEQVAKFLPRLGKATFGLVRGVTEAIVILFVTLYALANPRPLIKGFLAAVPPSYRKEATHALTRIVGQLEAWALATFLMMVVVGVAAGVGLALMHVPNAFLFGVLAGFGEAIPTVGPILSAIPPFIVAVGDEPMKGLWVMVLFLVVQQTESHLLVPWIMSRNLNLHPVSILFFVVVLGSTMGISGALLAVPAAIVVKVVYEEFYQKKRAPREDALEAAAEEVIRAGERIQRTPPEKPKPAPVPVAPPEG